MTDEKAQGFDGVIGFIGGGQMAGALINGLLAQKFCEPAQILASDPSEDRRRFLADSFGIEATDDNMKVIGAARVILLAIKPQVMAQVLGEIAAGIGPDHLVISIAAGVSSARLEALLPQGTRVVRVMPNTPALVQTGAAALCAGTAARKDDLELVQRLLGAVGVAVVVEERLMDAVTGLSGSGPAYVFTFIEGLIEAGVREGLPRAVAQELVIQTVLGSAVLCRETGKHPAELTAMVTSPGGTTIAGLHALEKGAFRGVLMDAVVEATKRSKELGG